MSRPRRSDHVRQALIEAGMNQISAYGYHGTGIKQILDQVKVPKGSFYNFFASKEAFVAEIIAAYTEDVLQQLNEFISGAGATMKAKQQLQAIYEFSLNKFAQTNFQHSCIIGSLATEISAESDECREQLKRSTTKWLAFFTERVELAQIEGDIRKDVSAEQLANIYWATWEGALIKVHVNKQIEPAMDAMEIMLNKLLAAN